MSTVRPRKLLPLTGLMILSTAYFAGFSSLDINSLLKNYLILVPIQVAVLGYLFWLNQRERISLK